MLLLEDLHSAIESFADNISQLTELEIVDEVNRLSDQFTEEIQAHEVSWERIAFLFRERKHNSEGYFGTLSEGTDSDGNQWRVPEPNDVTEEIVEYWKSRAKETNNPILKNRYALLAFEFSESLDVPFDVVVAQMSIDSACKIAKGNLYKYPSTIFLKLEKALSIALKMKDQKRCEQVRDSILGYKTFVSGQDKRGFWSKPYILLLENKSARKLVSEELEKQIIDDLENRLANSTDRTTDSFDTFDAEGAAELLASYYRRKAEQEDVVRVLLAYGQAVEIAADDEGPMLAHSRLAKVESVYTANGMTTDATRLRTKLIELGKRSKENMAEFSTSIEIPKKEMDEFLDCIVVDTLEETLSRIAFYFLPDKNDIEQLVHKLASTAPLSYLMPRKFYDANGIQSSTIHSLDEDLNGHLINQLAQNMQFTAISLNATFERMNEKHSPDVEVILKFIIDSPLFDEASEELLKVGISHFLNLDYLSAIHCLVPQIERAIRNLVHMEGGITTKRNDIGGFDFKTFGALLHDSNLCKVLEDVFKKDVCFYLRVLFVDSRGWNLRNDIFHGLVSADSLGYMKAQRVIHVLLLLSLLRPLDLEEENNE